MYAKFFKVFSLCLSFGTVLHIPKIIQDGKIQFQIIIQCNLKLNVNKTREIQSIMKLDILRYLMLYRILYE